MVGHERVAVRKVAGLVAGAVCLAVSSTWGAHRDGRQVLGVMAVQGEVWTQLGDAAEIQTPGSGGAIVEKSRIRTGASGAALLTLSRDGAVGLRANSVAQVGAKAADGPHIELVSGEALIRIPMGSHLTLTTSSATIRSEALQPEATGPARPQQASIRITPEGQTVVRVRTGALRVESREGAVTTVRAGEEATLARDRTLRVVAVAAGGNTPPAASATAPAVAPVAVAKPVPAASGSIFGADAGVAALAATAVAAGTVGGLGGSGAFSGSSDSTEAAEQASPFRPRRHRGHH